MRLFIALDLPPGLRGELAAWRDAELRGRDDLRPVPEPALHVTLVFLGETAQRDVAPVWRAVAGGAAGAGAAPVLRARDVEPVPPRRPRLFALALADDGGHAATLHAAVETRLAQAGLHEPAGRAFWPHVTLARARGGGRVRRWEPPARHDRFVPPSITLYESRSTPGGSRYRAVRRCSLGGAPTGP